MSDKRKYRRVSLLYYLKVYDLATKQCLGHLVDISAGGLKMISESQIDPEKSHDLSIYLPEDHPHEAFNIKAEICWSTTDINPDYIASGFRFIGLSPAGTKFIKMLISRYELGNGTSSYSY